MHFRLCSYTSQQQSKCILYCLNKTENKLSLVDRACTLRIVNVLGGRQLAELHTWGARGLGLIKELHQDGSHS